MHRLLPLLGLCVACSSEPAAQPGPAAGSKAASNDQQAEAPENGEAKTDSKATGEHIGWELKDYLSFSQKIVKLEQGKGASLPSLKGSGANEIKNLSSLSNAIRVFDKIESVPDMLAFVEALGQTAKIYTSRVAKGESVGEEYVIVSSVANYVNGQLLPAMLLKAGLTVEALRLDDIRRQGIVQARHGVFASVLGLLRSMHEHRGQIDLDMGISYYSSTVSSWLPLLLDSEIDSLVAELGELKKVGAGDEQLKNLEEKLRAPRKQPGFVVAFANEHSVYSQEQFAMLSKIESSTGLGVKVVQEPGGIRYTNPQGSVSAIFSEQPKSMMQFMKGADGGNVQTFTLGSRDATHYAQSITCFVQSKPSAVTGSNGWDSDLLKKMGATSINEIKIAGLAGKESIFEAAGVHSVTQAVPIGNAGCVVVVEHPKAQLKQVEKKTKIFLKSIKLDITKFEGESK